MGKYRHENHFNQSFSTDTFVYCWCTKGLLENKVLKIAGSSSYAVKNEIVKNVSQCYKHIRLCVHYVCSMTTSIMHRLTMT